jgi:hypothetical protein
MGAVGIHSMAVDNSWQYRPHESPANLCFTSRAGDAGGIFPTLAVLDHRPVLSVSSSNDQGAFKAALNALVADERTVDGPEGPNR